MCVNINVYGGSKDLEVRPGRGLLLSTWSNLGKTMQHTKKSVRYKVLMVVKTRVVVAVDYRSA
jgi:hypothetical protein